MQKLTEKVFEMSPPGGIFDETVVRNIFSNSTEPARKLFVHRAVVKNEVVRIKPGLFCLASLYRKSDPHPFLIASKILSPSYISLESALSFHGLIPEAVFETASVTSLRSRRFKTPSGIFSYHHIPSNESFAGVESVKLGDDAWAFVATPLKAIADIIYLRKEICWEKDGIEFLISSMRIDEDELRSIARENCPEIIGSIRNRRTKQYLEMLVKELK